jgi:methylenetetrahydrofolate dehydrogenase (NADP+)/methenyltetrahydrofolate cyclohydrolase
MLIQDDKIANATVTVCHEYTENIKEVLCSADIVVTAVGRRDKYTLTGDMIKKGAVVIDVAIVRDGKRLMGDADESVWEKAAWVTPVPGGVGLVTCTALLNNVIIAAEAQNIM